MLSLLNDPTNLDQVFKLVDLGNGFLQLVPQGLLGSLLSTVTSLLGPVTNLTGANNLLGQLQILK